MPDNNAEALFTKGLEALNRGNTVVALTWFEKSWQINPTPTACSYFAYCMAKERGQIKKAISICAKALQDAPDNHIIYLNLGKIYLLAGNKTGAIQILREGLDNGEDPLLIAELSRLGTRKPPVFSFLPRNNSLNKFVGRILCKLGLR